MPEKQALNMAEFQALAEQHGGVVGTTSDQPTDVGKRTLDKVSGRFYQPYATTFTFRDGQKVNLTWNQQAEAWMVDDWSTVGKAVDQEAKASQSVRLSPGESIVDPQTGQVIMQGQALPKAVQPSAMQQAKADFDEMAKYLSDQVRAGTLTQQQADRQMSRYQQAVISGTTPYQLEQDEQKAQQQREALQYQRQQQRAAGVQKIASELMDIWFAQVKRGAKVQDLTPEDIYRAAATTYDQMSGAGQQQPMGPTGEGLMQGATTRYARTPEEAMQMYPELGGGPPAFSSAPPQIAEEQGPIASGLFSAFQRRHPETMG